MKYNRGIEIEGLKHVENKRKKLPLYVRIMHHKEVQANVLTGIGMVAFVYVFGVVL